MGKLLDFLMTDSWEEFQRVRLFKKLGKAVEDMTDDELEAVKEELEKRKGE